MTRILIDDPSDPRLDDIRDLKHSDAKRDLVFGEGPLVCGRLAQSRFPLRSVIGFGGRLDAFLASHGDVAAAGVPVYEVSRSVLAQVAGYDMHRGLLAVGERPAPLPVEDVVANARTLVILEGVGDHENIGAIFRNAAGMDVDGVLFGAGCADPLYRRSVRVSMGHVLRTPFAHLEGSVTTWQRSLQALRDQGWWLVSLTPASDSVHIADAVGGHEKVAFLVGGEGPGLTPHAMRATDVRARIPMAAGTDSLNVATSAAIAFYERQRSLR
ncbi:23S rRNA (adenosine(1067)-2'-O)-methyltransferase [Corynebacterium capitovis DSM 44611]|uniref:TrmH family RNA methyltransferase n=1 Tax=Corynebacterium capitovis TaxID=131081 RepID=UPI000381F749|nr:RNA methyltransferase [Corynebacterium capitovis]WKD58074.1 23S rRNA (adenosine(1067)-2'-O)-methyltransferase [Corynebacterium capitovis DSM 44611]